MIKKRKADLNGDFTIFIFGWDRVMSFRGYSVSILPGVEDFVELVKKT
jgi:hypothetical protein